MSNSFTIKSHDSNTEPVKANIKVFVADPSLTCHWFSCPQVDKAPEGAGPLRSVKSDGQADERTSTTVNSVCLTSPDL